MREIQRDSAETAAWVEHVSIIFDDDDLARVRLAPRVEPIMEVQAAAHYRRLREHPLLGGWGQRTSTALGPAGGPVLRDLRSGAFQVFGLGMLPDPARKVDIHGMLDAALSRPTRDWLPLASELKALGMAVPPGLGEGRPETLDRLGHSVRLFHDVAVDPYWRRLNAAAAAAVSSWAQTMSMQGLEALLRNLRSNVVWRRPVLQLAVDTRICTPDCPHHRVVAAARTHDNRFAVSEHGLTIVPSFFGAELMIWMDWEPKRGPVAKLMAVPVDTDVSIFEPPTTAPPTDPLCELLGPTRSCVLRACLDSDLTTSALARMVGISQSSASEHASVLRAAGLISSVRTGRSVLHRITPIGVALVYGTRRPVHQWSSRRPIAARDRLPHPLG